MAYKQQKLNNYLIRGLIILLLFILEEKGLEPIMWVRKCCGYGCLHIQCYHEQAWRIILQTGSFLRF